MIKMLLLEKDDINVINYGFNAQVVQGDIGIIVQANAVNVLIDQLLAWQLRQPAESVKKEYLRQTEDISNALFNPQ